MKSEVCETLNLRKSSHLGRVKFYTYYLVSISNNSKTVGKRHKVYADLNFSELRDIYNN